MANRPEQHEIADEGVAEVGRILTKAGWACERVQADYGEDLICQTSFKQTVDLHRILIQVKSTNKKFSRTPPKIRIKRNTILKWLSDSNLVIVCFWSIEDKKALYQIPSDQFQLYDVDLAAQPYYATEFSFDNVLTEKAVHLLAWKARLRSINLHFLERKNEIDCLARDQFSSNEEYEIAITQLQKNLFAVGLKFLFYIGLVETNGPNISIDKRSCINELLRLGERATATNKLEIKKLKLRFDAIIILVILMRAGRAIPEVGFPQALVENSVRIFTVYLILRIRAGDPSVRSFSDARIKRTFVSMARRLWMFGSTLSPDEIDTFVESNKLSFAAKG